MSMGPDGGCGVPVDGWGVVVAGGGEGEGGVLRGWSESWNGFCDCGSLLDMSANAF